MEEPVEPGTGSHVFEVMPQAIDDPRVLDGIRIAVILLIMLGRYSTTSSIGKKDKQYATPVCRQFDFVFKIRFSDFKDIFGYEYAGFGGFRRNTGVRQTLIKKTSPDKMLCSKNIYFCGGIHSRLCFFHKGWQKRIFCSI